MREWICANIKHLKYLFIYLFIYLVIYFNVFYVDNCYFTIT